MRTILARRKLAYNESKVSRMSKAAKLERISELIENHQFDTPNRDWLLVEILKLACFDENDFASTATGLGLPTKEER